MFKKAKRRIVVTVLSILCTVLIGTLVLVYCSSYLTLNAGNFDILEQHALTMTTKTADELPDADMGNQAQSLRFGNKQKPEKIKRHLEANVFYTVFLSSDKEGQVLENGADELFTDEELISLALEVSNNSRGSTGELLYVVKEEEDGVFVCFMDNGIFSDNFNQVFVFTGIFGILAVILITFISMYIANRIVSPMEESYQKQKQFTADAGHELKTPVAAMAANIELLSREIGPNRWLDNISYENARMQDLVTELLELARNENRTLNREKTDLSHLVNGVILSQEAAAFEKSILIDSDVAENITAVVDEKGISQLVTILVDNAVSHTECSDGSIEKVSVRLTDSKGAVKLTVSNPGQEIPESEREKLFERFYRTDGSREFTGHYGLGLAIAKAIADSNEAKLSVSCKEGQVIFSVLFPS